MQVPSNCLDEDMKKLRYSLTGDIVCDCQEGWQRHDDVGNSDNFTCHQHSTQAWCQDGQILKVTRI